MIIVVIALAIGVILTLSFLTASNTSVAIASNVNQHATARHVAETGLQTVIDAIQADDGWRDTFSNGQWFADQAFAGGTFSVWAYDGEDLDGDGTVDGGDGDLSDDPDDPVTLVVRGSFGGVSHTARAVLRPVAGGGIRLAMIVRDAENLIPREQSRLDLIEGWGWDVTLVSDHAPSAEIAALGGSFDIVYALEISGSDRVGQLLRNASSGVVFEDGPTGEDLALAQSWSDVSTSVLSVSDNAHGVTTGLPLGAVALTTADVSMEGAGGALAGGDVLLVTADSAQPMVLAVETGTTGLDNQPIPGRRVASPFSEASASDLTPHGEKLLRQMLQWAAGEDPTQLPQAVVLYEFAPTYDAPTLVGHWTLDDEGGGASGGTPGLSLGDRLVINSHARVDGYDSASGKYTPGHSTTATVSTNSTSSNDIQLSWHANLIADVLVGPGGNPDQVINDQSGSSHQGSSGTLATAATFDAPVPTGSFTNGSWNPPNKGKDKGKQTISQNTRFGNLTLNSHETMIIDGQVKIDVTGSLNINAHSNIEIPAGSSLELYVRGNMTINSHCSIGDDSAATDRFMLSLYDGDSTLNVNSHASIIGRVIVDGDVTINSHSAIYGSLAASDDVTLNSHGELHLDSNLAGASAPVPVGDDAAANDGLATGVTIMQDGQIGYAQRFDGAGVVVIPHDDRYLIDAGAVSLWFRADSVGGEQGLFSKDANGYDHGGHLSLRLENGHLVARLQSNGTSHYVSASGVSANQWHHAVVSFGPAGLKLFLDGHQRDTDAYTGGLGTSSGSTGNTEPIALGADAGNSNAGVVTPLRDYFTGLLDDVRIYDGQFDQTQADNLYGGEAPGLSSTPGQRLADTSGYGQPLDLYIDRLDRVTFLGGDALRIDDAVSIASPGAATKLHSALAAHDAFAVELLVTPADLVQDGPASVVAYAGSGSTRNLAIGQDAGRFATRLRTTSTGTAGTPTLTSSSVLTAAAEHWVISYEPGEVRYYRNGSLVNVEPRTGTLANWDAALGLVLANSSDADVPWLGTLDRVAVYDRAPTPTTVADLYADRLPGGGGGGTTLRATWIERP